jgi:hypothetical protein
MRDRFTAKDAEVLAEERKGDFSARTFAISLASLALSLHSHLAAASLTS